MTSIGVELHQNLLVVQHELFGFSGFIPEPRFWSGFAVYPTGVSPPTFRPQTLCLAPTSDVLDLPLRVNVP